MFSMLSKDVGARYMRLRVVRGQDLREVVPRVEYKYCWRYLQGLRKVVEDVLEERGFTSRGDIRWMTHNPVVGSHVALTAPRTWPMIVLSTGGGTRFNHFSVHWQ